MASQGLSSSISNDTDIIDIDVKKRKENEIKNAQYNRESTDYLLAPADKNKAIKNDNDTESIDSKGTPRSLSTLAQHNKQIFTKPISCNGRGGVHVISLYRDDVIACNDEQCRIIEKYNPNKKSLTCPKRILPSDPNTDKHSEVEESSNPN